MIKHRLSAYLSATPLAITLECFLCLFEAVIKSYSCICCSGQFVLFIYLD